MRGQSEFRLGVVGVIDGGRVACPECRNVLPLEARICPVCGFERAPYPAGKVERFRWVFEQQIDAVDKLVLLALTCHDLPNNAGIFPSQERLARMTGLSRRSVIRALERLRAAGWIERHKTRRGDGRQGSNGYAIRQPGNDPRVSACHSGQSDRESH